jgi:hypothetical protein
MSGLVQVNKSVKSNDELQQRKRERRARERKKKGVWLICVTFLTLLVF